MRIKKQLRIGIDFDNTIVCYEQLFHQIAVEKEFIVAKAVQ